MQFYCLNYNKGLLVIFSLLVFASWGCKKMIAVDSPYTSINAGNVYESDATAIAAVTGVYTKMSASSLAAGESTSNSLFQGLSADEFTLYSGITGNLWNYYYSNLLNSSNTGLGYWGVYYPLIFMVNSALEGLEKSSGLTASVKQQLIGEAKFIRAFCYFYLVNLYGDVPLATSTDPSVNSHLSRIPVNQVYNQIIVDLKDAQQLLSSDYEGPTLLISTTERIRPNKWAATALLARAYLFSNDFTNAEVQATEVINSSMYSLVELNDVFLRNSNEAIWQLQPVKSGINTDDAILFILPSTGPNSTNNPVYLSESLINSFEYGDQRRGNWIDSVIVGNDTYYFPFKYKVNIPEMPVTEYLTILRLAEQYLIRAEARAQRDDFNDAVSDLNAVRLRAGVDAAKVNDKSSLLEAILHERYVEFFTEWGHRWLDLKRTGKIDAVMSIATPLKTPGASWKTYQQLYPLPSSEIQKNKSLTQNAGY